MRTDRDKTDTARIGEPCRQDAPDLKASSHLASIASAMAADLAQPSPSAISANFASSLPRMRTSRPDRPAVQLFVRSPRRFGTYISPSNLQINILVRS